MDQPDIQVAEVEIPSPVGPLFMRTWRPRDLASGRAVLIVPGFAMHGEVYAPLAIALAKRGAIAGAVDLPGNGRTGGKLTLRSAQAAVLASLDWVEGLTGASASVVGVSAGGAYVLSLGKQANRANRLAFIAPGLLVRPSQAVSWNAARDLWRLGTGRALDTLGWRLESASTNPEFLSARRVDPLRLSTVPASYLSAVIGAAVTGYWRSSQINRPSAIWQGTSDRLISPFGSRLLARRLNQRPRRLRMVRGGEHSLIWDARVGPRVISEVVRWVLGDDNARHAREVSNPVPS